MVIWTFFIHSNCISLRTFPGRHCSSLVCVAPDSGERNARGSAVPTPTRPILRAHRPSMGFFSFLFPWSLILQAIALIHFIRRRPDGYWLFIIVFLGPMGALVYIAMEVVPDLGLLRASLDAFSRRKRIAQLEAIVVDNPAVGNFEELADLCL